MKEERFMILTMLQEGKISSEEAAKLLEALEEVEVKDLTNDQDSAAAAENISHNSYNRENKINEKFEKLGHKLEGVGQKIEEKVEKKFKNSDETFDEWGNKLGEKMGRIGDDIADGATNLTDKILKMVDGFLDKGNFNSALLGNYVTVTETLEKSLEGISSPSLEFQAMNGRIKLIPWSDDKVQVKAVCHIKKNTYRDDEQVYEIVEIDNKISFRPKITHNIGIRLDVFVPERSYENITLLTTNGRIEIDGLESKNVLCNTTNSSIIVNDTSSEYIDAQTKNAKIGMNDVTSNTIKAVTTNSSIVFEDIDSKAMSAITTNGKFVGTDITTDSLNVITSNGSVSLDDFDGEDISIRTSNGSIVTEDVSIERLKSVDFNTTNGKIDISFDDTDASFIIDANTSMGHINIDFPMEYEINSQKNLGSKRVKGRSLDSNTREININLSNSNGSININ